MLIQIRFFARLQ